MHGILKHFVLKKIRVIQCCKHHQHKLNSQHHEKHHKCEGCSVKHNQAAAEEALDERI